MVVTKTITVAGKLRISGRMIENVITEPFAPAYRVVAGGELIVEPGTELVQREWQQSDGQWVCNTAIIVDGGILEADKLTIRNGNGIEVYRGNARIRGGEATGLQKYLLKTGDMDNDPKREAGMVIIEDFRCLDGSTKESTIRDQGSKNLIIRRCDLGKSTRHEKEVIALRLPKSAVLESNVVLGMVALGYRIPGSVGDSDAKIGRNRPSHIHFFGGEYHGMITVNGNVHVAAQNFVMLAGGGGGWALNEKTHVCADGKKLTGEIIRSGVSIAAGMKHSAGVQVRAAAKARWKEIVSRANATNV